MPKMAIISPYTHKPMSAEVIGHYNHFHDPSDLSYEMVY